MGQPLFSISEDGDREELWVLPRSQDWSPEPCHSRTWEVISRGKAKQKGKMQDPPSQGSSSQWPGWMRRPWAATQAPLPSLPIWDLAKDLGRHTPDHPIGRGLGLWPVGSCLCCGHTVCLFRSEGLCPGLQLSAILTSTPEGQGQRAGRLPKLGAPAF